MATSTYSVQEESKRVLLANIIEDPSLPIHPHVAAAAKKVEFVGTDSQPFVPTPCKLTESASALTGFVAAAASAVASDRYGIEHQDIEVDTDLATLFIESLMLPTVGGKPFLANPQLLKEIAKGDLYKMGKPIHEQGTSVYKTKDGRWYHLHASMNAGPVMKMLGIEEQDLTREEAIKLYIDKVGEWDSAKLDEASNEQYRQAGVICYTPEEFFETEQGKVSAKEALYTQREVKAPRSQWPAPAEPSSFKPLAGIRVIDFSRVIASPVVSKLLALLGADVLKVSNKDLPDISATWVDLSTGKRDTNVDMKTPEGKKIFESLVKDADVIINGYRPGVLARFGFDSDSLRKINPSIIYVKECCYGFNGPWSHRSGWQQISDCLVGISWLQGKFFGLNEPVVPLLPNSDYQTGLVGAAAIVQALLGRTKADVTYDIDLSLTQYNVWYYRLGQYSAEQQEALLERNKGFLVRHYDGMVVMLVKIKSQIEAVRPDLSHRADFYSKMSGKEWGLDEDITILGPPFKLAKSVLEYITPSGSRGRSKAEWLPRPQAVAA